MNNSIFPMVTTFFVLSFSSVLLPMDPPIIKPLKEYNSYEACQLLQRTGGIFSNFPADTLIPVLIGLSPIRKNILGKANRAFNVLLSRENPQPFMFCPELCANGTDKVSLGIKILNAIIENPSIHKNQLRLLYETGFMNHVCPIIGAQEKDIRFDLSDSSTPCLDIATYIGYQVTVQYNTHPFVQACLTRCPNDIASCIANEKFNKKFWKALIPSDIELLSSFVVQNNDVHSLELIHSQGIYEKGKNDPNSSALLQIAIFCGSDKVVPLLFKLYRSAQVERGIGSFAVSKTMDYLGVLLEEEKCPTVGESLQSIIIAHHSSLFNVHAEKNNLNRYNACLQPILKKKCLENLYPSIEIEEQSDRKKEKESKQKCHIM